MSPFIQQLLDLLTTFPGNMTYHLVLGFALMAALVLAFRQWFRHAASQSLRTTLGLFLLMGGRFVLFLLAALALTNTINQRLYLPPVDRGVTAFSVIVIIWLWAFPKSTKLGDIASILVGMLVLVAAVLSVLLWAGQSALAFNNHWLDLGWEGLSIALTAFGALTLLLRRPKDWGVGLAMLLLMLAGHAAHALAPDLNSDLPGMVRLAQIAAYPILIVLAQRLATEQPAPVIEPPAQAKPAPPLLQKDTKGKYSPEVLDELLTLLTADDPLALDNALTSASARLMHADICFLLSSPNEQQEAAITSVYDLIREQRLPNTSIHISKIPEVWGALDENSPLRLPLDAETRDLQSLRQGLDLGSSGSLLLAPFERMDTQPVIALCLLTPYSQRVWSAEDGKNLVKIAQILGEIRDLPRDPGKHHNMERLKTERDKARAEAEHAHESAQGLLEELLTLREEISQAPSEAARMAPLLEAQEQAQARIAKLELQNQQLEEALQNSGGDSTTLSPREQLLQQKVEILSEDNEEAQIVIAHLQQEIEKLDAQLASPPNNEREFAEKYAQLQTENMQLAAALAEFHSAANSAQRDTLPDNQSAQYEAELRSTLSEVARLQKRLGEFEIKTMQLEKFAQAKPKDYQKWDMIAAIAQELRQPMSSVVGYSDFLLSESVGILGALQRKFLERVKTSTERMNMMVEDLLQIAAVEAGQVSLAMEIVDLTKSIDNAVSRVQSQLREKSIVLTVDIPDNLPSLQGDKEAIQQILLHLLHNAEAATPSEGNIAIIAKSESYGSNHNYVLFQISDSGNGIHPDDIPRVFKQDSKNTEGTSIPGTGATSVNLAVTKTLIEAHGGRIWIDSELGNGATFSLVLPLKQSAPVSNLGSWRT